DGNVDKSKTTIGDIEVKKDPLWGTGAKGSIYSLRYDYAVSADRMTLLCYYRKKDDNKIVIKALKEDLSKLWEKEIELPLAGKDMVIEDAVMSGDNTYFLAAIPVEKEKNKYTYAIVEYSHTSDKVTKKELNIPADKYVTDYNLKTDKSGNIIFNAIYESNSGDGVTGAYFARIDNGSGNYILSKDFPFEKDFLTQFITEKKVDKGHGIDRLKIKEVLPQDDNSLIVATEQGSSSIGHSTTYYTLNPTGGMQQTQFSQGFNSHAVTTTVESYDYFDGVIYKINQDGSMAWVKDIPKLQDMSSASATAPVASSYSISIFNSKMYLLFNDNRKNADLTADGLAKSKDDMKVNHIDGGHSWQIIVFETVDLATGNLKRRKLNDFYENGELYFYANFYYQLPDKVIVFSSTIFKAHKKDDGQFGEFTINMQQ
ncbi:MAG TPA: hypothetical protein VK890_05725, partial [Bacteroidia bacterium]|nr:hypothetical protein [Bacteroidia bacterium]